MLAVWETDENPAIVKRTFGKGTVCEIGFFYGFEYTGRIAPHVPLTQRNNELYPLTMLKKDPVGMLLEEKFGTTLTRKKGVERAEFENGTVIVNHAPIRAESMNPEHAISRIPSCTRIWTAKSCSRIWEFLSRGKFEKFFKLFRVCCRALTSRWKIVIIKTTAFAVVFLIVQKTSFPYDKKRAARMRTPIKIES